MVARGFMEGDQLWSIKCLSLARTPVLLQPYVSFPLG
jgi:hypothetical protein